MLFGELVPKNAALARPMRVARATAGPMRTFSPVFGWLIRALNGSANWLVRRLGVEPQEELASARSPEELGLLAAISARAGALPERDRDAAAAHDPVRREARRRGDDPAGRRGRRCAADATVAELLDAGRGETGHSRFPVYEETARPGHRRGRR